MEINYKKNKNDKLFNNLEESLMGVYDIQNYIPIYQNFFSLNESNYNNINLNNKYYFLNV